MTAPLNVGDNVMIKENKTWKPATVSGKANGPQSYLVTTPEGQTYRRNRRYMRRFPVQSYQDDQDDEDDVLQPNRRDSGDSDTPQNDVNQDTPSDAANEENAPDTQPLRRSSRSVTRPERYVETHTSRF